MTTTHLRKLPVRLAMLLLGGVMLAGCDTSMPSWIGGDDESEKEESKLPGDRIRVLPSEASLEVDPLLPEQDMTMPSQGANDAWITHGGLNQMIMGNLQLSFPLNNEQSATIGEGESFEFRRVPDPVVAAGTVFVMDAAGFISAHDAANIDIVKWKSPGVSTPDEDPVIGGGMALLDETLYVTSGRGVVAAFDMDTGTEKWRQMLNIPIRSAPRVDRHTVYVVTVDSQLYALDTDGGAIRWNHRGLNEGSGYLVDASPAVVADIVIAPYGSGEIQALRASDGTTGWSDAVLGPPNQSASSVFTGIGADPVVAEGVVFSPGASGMFAANHLATGQRIWEQLISSVDVPWVAGEYIFVLTSDARVVALHRMTGRIRWIAELPRYDDPDDKSTSLTWNGPVIAGNRLLIVGAHGKLVTLDLASGAEIETISIPDGIYSAPVVANGTLYLVSEDATLYAIN